MEEDNVEWLFEATERLVLRSVEPAAVGQERHGLMRTLPLSTNLSWAKKTHHSHVTQFDKLPGKLGYIARRYIELSDKICDWSAFKPPCTDVNHSKLRLTTHSSVLSLPWKQCSWYSNHTKLFKHNESATEWQCTLWKVTLNELKLMNLCRPASGVQFSLRHSV